MPEPTILLIDDSTDDTDLARHALSDSHLSNPVVCLPTCEDALRWLETNTPILILLDLGFKGTMPGLEFLDRLHSQPATRNINVVVLTGTDTDLAETYARGVTCHLLKPVRGHALLEAIRNTVLHWTITN